jgi:hypothetical protein
MKIKILILKILEGTWHARRPYVLGGQNTCERERDRDRERKKQRDLQTYAGY